jgi:hypothetical protein
MEHSFTVTDVAGNEFTVSDIACIDGKLYVNGHSLHRLGEDELKRLATFLEKKYGKFQRVSPYTVVGVDPETGKGYQQVMYDYDVNSAASKLLDMQDLLIAAVYEGYLPVPFLGNDNMQPYLTGINKV